MIHKTQNKTKQPEIHASLSLELTDYQITRYQTQHIVTLHYTHSAPVDSLFDDEDSDSKSMM